MDDDIREAFEFLKRDLTYLYRRWTLYGQLFGTNTHRLDVINRTAPDVISEFQWLAIDNMILALSGITDPAGSGKKINLSLQYLVEKLEGESEAELVDALKETLVELTESVDKFRGIRNKRLAHKDLAVALESTESPLPGVSRAQISAALALVAKFLNLIDHYFFKNSTNYEVVIIPLTSDGRALCVWLQKGLAYEALADTGAIDPDFWVTLGNIDEKNT